MCPPSSQVESSVTVAPLEIGRRSNCTVHYFGGACARFVCAHGFSEVAITPSRAEWKLRVRRICIGGASVLPLVCVCVCEIDRKNARRPT